MSAQAVRLTGIDIDNALGNAHLNIVYQPIVSFDDRRVLRYEAFVRWDHPGLGPLPPGAFLSFFETQGRIGDLTRYVIDKTLKAGGQAALDEDIGVSVNLSASDIQDPKLAKTIGELLHKHDWPARRLTLECPLLSPNIPVAQQQAAYEALADTGCPLSLEVRGRASDAMKAMSPFPFREIKTGGPAVLRQLRSSRGGPGLNTLSELLGFAKERDVSIVAVGVEDREAAASLGSLGFNAGQGNVLGRASSLPGVSADATPADEAPLDLQGGAEPLDLSSEENQSLAQSQARRARIAAAKRAAMRRLRTAVTNSAGAPAGGEETLETARSLQSRLENHFPKEQAGDVSAAEDGLFVKAFPDKDAIRRQTKTSLDTSAAADPAEKPAKAPSPVETLLRELPADLRQPKTPEITVAPRTPPETESDAFAPAFAEDDDSPADRLDRVIDELPTLPADTTATDETTPRDDEAAGTTAAYEETIIEDDDEVAESDRPRVKRQWKITHFWPRSWRRWNRRRLARKAERQAEAEALFREEIESQHRAFGPTAKGSGETGTDKTANTVGREGREQDTVPVVTEREKDPLVFGPLADLR